MTTENTETAADAFLNWVRHRERPTFVDMAGESQATGWCSFFADNMGMFLRNAVIYEYPGGMVQFYKDKGGIPQTSITIGTVGPVSFLLRLTPDSLADNVIGSSTSNLPGSNGQIFGWLNEQPAPNLPLDSYWLLVADSANRLVWVASDAIIHSEAAGRATPETIPTQLAPDRNYSSADLEVIIGANQ